MTFNVDPSRAMQQSEGGYTDIRRGESRIMAPESVRARSVLQAPGVCREHT